MGVGKDQNDALRIAIALVATAIIVVAVYISKQREVSIGSDGPETPVPPAPVSDPQPTQPVQPTV
jgi:K(+)-stimulated pyrophosphate-energized sodium pump